MEKTDFIIQNYLKYQLKLNQYDSVSVSYIFNGKRVDIDFNSDNSQNKSKKFYQFASHTKMFTSVMIFLLIEQGKMKLDDEITELCSQLEEFEELEGITARQILSHSSGLIRDGHDYYWDNLSQFPDKKRLLEYTKKPIFNTFLPNEKYKYSNIGFAFLGLLIEELTNMKFQDAVDKYILKPLKLKNTHFEFDNINNKSGYQYNKLDHNFTKFENVDTKSLISAAGIWSTTEDMASFLDLILNKEFSILSAKSILEMTKIHSVSNNSKYCLGFRKYADDFYGHGGGFTGFSSITLTNKKNFTVSVAINSIKTDVTTIAKNIYQIIEYFANSNTQIDDFDGLYNCIWWQPFVVKSDIANEILFLDLNSSNIIKNKAIYKSSNQKLFYPLNSDPEESDGEPIEILQVKNQYQIKAPSFILSKIEI